MADSTFSKSTLFKNLLHRIRVRSALNPMLWLSAVFLPFCFSSAYLFKDYDFLRTFLVLIGVCPGMVTCGIAIYFSIKKPENLKSEDYQLRQQTLQMIQKGRIPIDATSLIAIANPALRQVESGGDEQS
jgi:hypothetical protein